MNRRLIPTLLAALLFSAQVAANDVVDLVDAVETAEQAEKADKGAESPGSERAPDANLPKQDLTPRLLYQFLLAEIAGSRGQTALSTEAYMDLARGTRDPRVARRATEMALMAKRYEAALGAAKLWAELDPQSIQPRQMVSGLLAATERSDELAEHLAVQLAAAGGNVGELLLQVNRILARYPDKLAAQRLVNKVTEPYLGLAEAHFSRAQAAHVVNDDGSARAELDRALILRPDWEQAALVRAQLTGDSAEAATFLGKFVAANPKANEARLGYARGLVALKRYSEARQEFKTLLAEEGKSGDMAYAVAVLSLQLNDFDEAEKQLKGLVDSNHAEINNARLYLGQIAEERKHWDEALEWYGQITAGNQYLPARMRIAQMLVKQKRLPEARRALQESVAADLSARAQLLIAEAQLLRDAGQASEAYAVLEGGLALHPDQSDLLYETAMAAEKAGNTEVSERYLRRLIEIKPDYAHAYNALGYSLAERNERLEEAQQLIDKALQLAPEDAFILDSKGWVLFRRGDAGAALEALKKAFAIRADPEIAAHMGEVLWALGRKDEARKTWGDAEKTNPGNEALIGTIKKFAP
jgi:tetratricopeptide (TPR) repeat protein